MPASFRVQVLETSHDASLFSCGTAALDNYFRSQVTQGMRRRASARCVAVENGTGRVAGYFTLAAGGIALTDLPAKLVKRLPRYPSVPVTKMGRLALDQVFQGQKLGATLLADAALRSMRSEVAVYALVVDAKDGDTAAFYRHHGFEPYGESARQLIVPLGSFKAVP
jgi:GNAT superfamily N-acetyltransferase